jgi:peptidoglycan/LPS O-acetylase OafA/YrhL
MTEQGRTPGRQRIWPVVIVIGVCLFVGFWGWAYQGYVEDVGSEPTQSWPIGVGGFAAAGVLALVATRRARPEMTKGPMVFVAICLAAVLAAGAVTALTSFGDR